MPTGDACGRLTVPVVSSIQSPLSLLLPPNGPRGGLPYCVPADRKNALVFLLKSGAADMETRGTARLQGAARNARQILQALGKAPALSLTSPMHPPTAAGPQRDRGAFFVHFAAKRLQAFGESIRCNAAKVFYIFACPF